MGPLVEYLMRKFIALFLLVSSSILLSAGIAAIFNPGGNVGSGMRDLMAMGSAGLVLCWLIWPRKKQTSSEPMD